MTLDKHPRIESRKYLDWVSTLPCADCKVEDGTVVAHHLKHRYSPFSGGTGMKASDYFTMPLCFECHESAHSGDHNVLDFQAQFIFNTLQRAFSYGILDYNEPKKFGEDLDD